MSPVYLGQMPGPSHSRLSNISRHCHAPSSPLAQGDVSCLVIVEGPGFRRNRGNWIKRIHYHCERTPDRTPVSLSLFRERVVREEILQIRIRSTEREREELEWLPEEWAFSFACVFHSFPVGWRGEHDVEDRVRALSSEPSFGSSPCFRVGLPLIFLIADSKRYFFLYSSTEKGIFPAECYFFNFYRLIVNDLIVTFRQKRC